MKELWNEYLELWKWSFFFMLMVHIGIAASLVRLYATLVLIGWAPTLGIPLR
jgi:hypothetical protein